MYCVNCIDVGVVNMLPEQHWMSVTKGMSGYFAVEMWINPNDGDEPFPEPWNTGIGRYVTEAEAYEEAKMLAQLDGMPCEVINL
jgi:hypothetical protein